MEVTGDSSPLSSFGSHALTEILALSSAESLEQEAEETEQRGEVNEQDTDLAAHKNEEQRLNTSSDVSVQLKEICAHPTLVKGACVKCRRLVDHVSAVAALGNIHKYSKVGSEELAELRDKNLKSLLRRKKLCLVLDLDHTLLHTTLYKDISPDEEYLKSQIQDLPNGNLLQWDSKRWLTKLRPFVRTFLKEASSMFEMCVYTLGNRSYAKGIARILDPGDIYFNLRVISKDDCTQEDQKSLDVVLGAESAVIILDDMEDVWEKHKENLILMDGYHYFSSSGRQLGLDNKSFSELKTDEGEPDGALATILEVLKRTHHLFFDLERDDDIMGRDVRQVLKTVRGEVLKGCKLVFSCVDQNKKLWEVAGELGATCCKQLDSSVTHVVSTDMGTRGSRWAVKHGKFLVHPRWLEAAYSSWKRQPEDNFVVGC